MKNDQIAEDSIFRIGKVISVDGRVVKIKMDKTKNSSHLVYKGELLKNISVGGYIKLIKGFTSIIGKVEGEFINEDKKFSGKDYSSDRENINRTLSVSLLGFFVNDKFERGIKELPLIDNECYLLKANEFNLVHNFIRNNDQPITIGTLALEKGQPISVGINSLLASHIGIFGNTGSGKSYTLAKIYREIFKLFKDNEKFKKNAKFFIIDFNGEYIDDNDNIIVEKEYKNIYKLSTKSMDGDKYPISKDTLNDHTFWTVFLEATEKTQTPFLRRAITNVYLKAKMGNEQDLKDYIAELIFSVTSKNDKNLEKGIVINMLSDLSEYLAGSTGIDTLSADYNQHLQFHTRDNKYYYDLNGTKTYSSDSNFRADIIDSKISRVTIPVSSFTLIDKIRIQIILQYYADIIRGYANKEHLAPLIKRMEKRIGDLKKVITDQSTLDESKNLTIISLKDVKIEIRKILPMLLCKKVYDVKKEENDNNTYLNIIIDEAHNILSRDSDRESEQWKDYRLETFEEIIKEGRKFGVFLTVASQRPSDISSTIISQLHNYFLHRLINNNDIMAIEKTISYLDKVSFEYLPILPTGSCILAGLLAQVPVVVDIGEIEEKYIPNNQTMTLTDKWK
jgi:DNA helicase HerA-like ATPase